MAADELDDLYGVKPEAFTARRAELAAVAKKRGDADAAKRISAARRPTTAAWVLNLLVLRNADVKRSLTDLRERLRAAHAAMDGAAIRELSAEQRSLVEELTRAAFQGADMANPSTSVKEDVAGTLQAAVADSDVTERLGHLAKAEQWSGFGDFGMTTAVSTATRSAAPSPKLKPEAEKTDEEKPREDRRRQAHEIAESKAALAAAERAKADADDEMSKRQTDLAVARLRRDEMQQRLEEAEGSLTAAEVAFDEAKRARRDAAGVVEKAKSRLTQSRRAH